MGMNKSALSLALGALPDRQENGPTGSDQAKSVDRFTVNFAPFRK